MCRAGRAPLVTVDDIMPPPDLRAPDRRRPGGPHPGHAEGGGRLRQLLHLLRHPYAGGRCAPCPGRRRRRGRASGREGYREIVLTGIEISSWGQDFRDGTGFIDLVEAVCAAPGCRVRLGSLEPRTVTEDFCRRCAALPNLCPHFHLSMQSGCDATLRG